ncbi:DNA polymerase III subunit alpha [Lihuaxuella thermophila]|uniref:DNA-directed DNA polymerase n=1 Tax=Lihuaxuella thermophila TaxID=1173111 RepID=A0A1H8C8W1_9BACL|nr:DNA polymerase III subunit alpha [Lihuaxuella thermophila]SEM91329.1 DNA polymerase-3 subunit alpha [Lihuaxuella thermophila]
MEFVHLHVHTEYSLPEAVCRLEELIKKAKSLGMTSLAIADQETMDGVIRFYELARKYGIHPIIGCEMKVEDGGMLILLAATHRGYQQMVGWLNNGFRPPDSHGDVIALSGGRNGTIHHLLRNGHLDRAKGKAAEYVKWFGKENFYLEIQHHGFAEDQTMMERTEWLSKQTGIPLVATHEVCYLDRNDALLVDLFQRKQTHPPARTPFDFPTPLEMEKKFRHLPEALANTVRISRRCRFHLQPGSYKLPKFPVPEPWSAEGYLKHLCQEGVRNRFDFRLLDHDERNKLIQRLNRELTVIINRGLASYFLIVWDLVRFARKNGIPVGPGRGSAAGSLVVYLLGITEVNPLEYGLSFERFLSPDRPDLPDIDLDVCQRRRQEVIQYLKDRYGADQVIHIGVFNAFGTRGAVREAGKRLDLPEKQIDLLAKLLPSFSGKGGIRHCVESLPEFTRIPVRKEPYQSLFRLAERLEGLPRHHSSHPSGMLIGDGDLERTVPLRRRPDGDWMTTYDKEDIASLGLLKIDLLGLRHLTIIHDTLKAVFERTGEQMEVGEIPLNDEKTFQTIAAGDTLGCFQLESMGIRNLMRRMQPKSLDDLSVLLALYRPGAWQEGIVETFLRRRNGDEEIPDWLPEIQPVLAPTCGLILYQEQVIQIAQAVAGYSAGEGDSLRRALSNKSLDALNVHRERFVRGALKKGRTNEEASSVFDFLARFAGYSFNKAHSVSYAYLAYWSVYLKTHFPTEFMASLLSTEGGYYGKKVYIREVTRMGISLLRPDINRSGFGFTPEENGIRIGLNQIKGSGPGSVAQLLQSRQKEGPFTSFRDFVARMKGCGIKAPVLKAWIAAGACDGLEENRRQMIHSLCSWQLPLFDDFSPDEKRRLEKNLLGFCPDGAPSKKWRQFMHEYQIVPIESLSRMVHQTKIRVSGAVIQFRRQRTTDGKYLLVLVLQDHSGMVEVVLYPEIYKAFLYQLNPLGIMVEGSLRTGNQTCQVIAEKIKALGG